MYHLIECLQLYMKYWDCSQFMEGETKVEKASIVLGMSYLNSLTLVTTAICEETCGAHPSVSKGV